MGKKKGGKKKKSEYEWETVQKLPKGFYRVFSGKNGPVLKRLVKKSKK